MKILRFVLRNSRQFVTVDELFLCGDEELLCKTIGALVKEYDVQKKEVDLGTFRVSEIEETKGVAPMKFKPVDFQEVMAKITS